MPAALPKAGRKRLRHKAGNLIPISDPDLMMEIESVPASATELLLEGLTEKTELLRIAKQKALLADAKTVQLQKRCSALTSLVAAAKKREREEAARTAHEVAELNPRKRPSPEVEPALVPSAVPRVLSPDSDDDVPLPAPAVAAEAAVHDKCTKFQQLSSILCAYKDGKVFPGSTNLPFDVCADLVRDEATLALGLSLHEKTRMLPCIRSALRLVYPDKKDAWFESPFLNDPKGAVKYWARVLNRRAEIWDAAALRILAKRESARTSSLKSRIRDKIAQRKAARLSGLKATPNAAAYVFKTPDRHNGLSLLSSDSDMDGDNVVDLSGSPATAAKPGVPLAAPTVTPPKMAPGPETYSLAEMKAQVRMAKAIRNVDEKEGHSRATAAFIDQEFSGACHATALPPLT